MATRKTAALAILALCFGLAVMGLILTPDILGLLVRLFAHIIQWLQFR